jgi:hypothetical protein
MTITMYDAVAYGNIPRDAQAVAGYISGPDNYGALVSTFPKAHHISIATGSEYTAQFLDVEHFDAVIADAPGWVNRMLDAGIWRPGVYANRAYWEEGGMAHDLEGYGDKIRRWIADWTFEEHIPDGYDACQWSGGQTLDISACQSNFFSPVADLDPFHIDWFFDKEFETAEGKINERKCVQDYDGARLHPIKYRRYLKRDLEPKLEALANRIARVALFDDKHQKRKHPEWDKDFRGWRYQQLLERSRGKQIVK